MFKTIVHAYVYFEMLSRFVIIKDFFSKKKQTFFGLQKNSNVKEQ